MGDVEGTVPLLVAIGVCLYQPDVRATIAVAIGISITSNIIAPKLTNNHLNIFISLASLLQRSHLRPQGGAAGQAKLSVAGNANAVRLSLANEFTYTIRWV